MFSFLVALAFTASAVARADASFNYSFVGVNNSITTSGTMTTVQQGNTNVYDITAITGFFTDTNYGLNIVDAPVTLVPNNGTATWQNTVVGWGLGYLSPDGQEVYDNLLYYPGNPLNLDILGVLFTADGYEISIAGVGSDYTAWVSVLGTSSFVDNSLAGEPLTGEVTLTPEPATLSLFGTGLLGIAGLLRKRMCR